MLLAVEGGGFFSASASGYTKGLSLLLLGQRNEDKPMRVAPWNQYQLVDQESDPELQLASTKNRLSRGCASFVCFGRTSAGLDTPSPLKVGPAQQHDVSPGPLVSNKGKDPSAHVVEQNDIDNRKLTLKSSIKKPFSSKSLPAAEAASDHEASGGQGICNQGGQAERRRVQWTDACGSELVEIREFEPRQYDFRPETYFQGVWAGIVISLPGVLNGAIPAGIPRWWETLSSQVSPEVDGSDDEFDSGNDRTCSCAIM